MNYTGRDGMNMLEYPDNCAKILFFLGMSVSLSGLGAWWISKFGVRLGVGDVATKRSSHSGIVPKGGGIGIVLAFMLNAVYAPIYLWLPATMVAFISFLGDYKDISPYKRLILQFACSLFFLLGLCGMPPGQMILWIPFFSLFMVGTANYYNFMDGIDGIAGLTGAVAFALIALYAVMAGKNDIGLWLSACVSAACLGFMPFNFPKARVFMGDVGSVFLGFLFACLVIFISETIVDFLVLSGFLLLFYFDEAVTTLIRLKRGQSLLLPHRLHVYQLLANEMGITHWKVSMGYGVVQLMIGLISIGLSSKGLLLLIFSYLIYGSMFFTLSYWVHKKTKHSNSHPA